jgi:hypothetical protein
LPLQLGEASLNLRCLHHADGFIMAIGCCQEKNASPAKKATIFYQARVSGAAFSLSPSFLPAGST